MRRIFTALLGLLALVALPAAWAQTSSGTLPYTCTQTGTQITCTFQATILVPSGDALVAGTGQTQVVIGASGVVANAPVCTALIPSLASVPAGGATSVTLSLSGCVAPALYTFRWAAPVATATGMTAVHSPNLSTATPSQTYTVTACLASNATACSIYSASVTLLSFAIPALNSCVVVASAASVPIGGNSVLTVNCLVGTGTGSGATYQWSRNSVYTGVTSSSYALSAADTAVAGSAIYSVQVSNAAPSTASASTTVTVTGSVTPPVASDGCASTPVRLSINASEPYRKIYTSDYAATFGPGNDFVIQFDVAGSDTTTARYLASIEFADFGASRGNRWATFSQSKCDYSDSAQWVTPNYSGYRVAVNAGRSNVAIGSDPRAGEVHLTTGRWYLNIKNVVGGCPSVVSCHAVVEWAN